MVSSSGAGPSNLTQACASEDQIVLFAAIPRDHLALLATPSEALFTHGHRPQRPNLAAPPLDLLKQVISEIEEMEKANALQSVIRMNHTEMNLNILVPGGPPSGSLAARARGSHA